jgi:GT2 family glycosyltransferase
MFIHLEKDKEHIRLKGRMKYPIVYIIVLNWNGLQDTIVCLDSVVKLNYPNFRLIVVDNGSTDGSTDIISKNYPKVHFIENNENLGYAKGNNVGIRYALENNADYVWLLNNDTVVEQHALLNMVVEAEKDPLNGIIGGKIYYLNSAKKIWFAGAMIEWSRGTSNHIGLNETDVGQYDYVQEIDRVAGCSMLVRREVCHSVGLLDENFFLYVEEVDWCVRARKAGFKCLFVPSSIVYHKASASVPQIGTWSKVFNYYNTRNFLYLIQKSFNSPTREILLLRVIFRKLGAERGNILKMLFPTINSSNKIRPYEFPVLFGIKDFLVKKMGKVDYMFRD